MLAGEGTGRGNMAASKLFLYKSEVAHSQRQRTCTEGIGGMAG